MANNVSECYLSNNTMTHPATHDHVLIELFVDFPLTVMIVW